LSLELFAVSGQFGQARLPRLVLLSKALQLGFTLGDLLGEVIEREGGV